MRTSARNQFEGTVKSVKKGAVNADVTIALKGGDVIVAQITMTSLENLGLKEGVPACAVIKSSWVSLAAGDTAPKLSTRNILPGKVTAVKNGAVNAEVVLKLAGGETIVSVITEESVKNLALSVGSKAWAIFKANTVIVAVA